MQRSRAIKVSLPIFLKKKTTKQNKKKLGCTAKWRPFSMLKSENRWKRQWCSYRCWASPTLWWWSKLRWIDRPSNSLSGPTRPIFSPLSRDSLWRCSTVSSTGRYTSFSLSGRQFHHRVPLFLRQRGATRVGRSNAIWRDSKMMQIFPLFYDFVFLNFWNGKVRSTLAKKMRNYLTDRQIGTSFCGFGAGSTRLMSQFANPSTQVEVEREARTVLDDQQQLQQLQPGSSFEKHPRHLLRASFSSTCPAAQQHHDNSLEPINKMMATTLV